MELWNKKYPDFIGYNCRITAFDLMKDNISVKADAKVNASNPFIRMCLTCAGKEIYQEAETCF